MSNEPSDTKLNEGQPADFALVNYSIVEVELKNLENAANFQLQVELNPSGVYDTNKGLYKVILETIVYNLNDKNSYVVKTKVAIDYTFKEGTAFDIIPDHFFPNFIAIAFPYVRAYISLITAQSQNINSILLPLLNLTNLAVPLKTNTKVIA